MIRPMLSGLKNAGGGSVPAITLAKPSIASWLPSIAPKSCLHLGRRRLHRGELARELEHRHRRFVTLLLVVLHRVVERPVALERLIERVDEELDVVERVGDAERGERVLVEPRVADERPARAVGLAEVVRQVTGTREALLALRATDALGELRRRVEQREIGGLDVVVVVVERARARRQRLPA